MGSLYPEGGVRTDGGCWTSFSPAMFVWHTDNQSLNGRDLGDSVNRDKNANVFSPKTVRSVAAMFPKWMKLETAPMLSCPASRETGDPRSWMMAYREALKHLTGEKEVEMGKLIEAATGELLDSNRDVPWDKALLATFWLYKEFGFPNDAFMRAVPRLITIQGQNRAAVLISVLADKVGVSRARAGRFGDIELFEGDDAAAKYEELDRELNAPHALVASIVHNFLDYKEAAKKGRETYKSESCSRKPGLYARLTKLKALVRQVFAPGENICQNRVSELLGSDWKQHLLPNPGVVVSDMEKRNALGLQRKVSDHVAKELLGDDLRAFKGKAYVTLAYANAMKPDAHIVKVVMRRLLDEDEGSQAVASPSPEERGVEDRENGRSGRCSNLEDSGKTTPECLAQLFSLLESTQHDPELCGMIREFGLSNKVKTFAVELAREELVKLLCESFANRRFCGGRGNSREIGGVVAVLPELVTDEEAERFTHNNGNGELMAALLADASSWFRHLSRSRALGADTTLLTSINKKAIQKALGRLEQADPTLSNKTCTEPGLGALPRLSTDATKVWFEPRVLREWLAFEDNPGKIGDSSKGKRARVLAVEFAALLVERALPNIGKFDKLWRAMDEHGLLKQMLKENPHALRMGSTNFFDDDRVSLMLRGGGRTLEGCGAAGDSAEGGGKAGGSVGGGWKPNVRLCFSSSTQGRLSFVNLPSCMLTCVGLLQADGTAVSEPVTVAAYDGTALGGPLTITATFFSAGETDQRVAGCRESGEGCNATERSQDPGLLQSPREETDQVPQKRKQASNKRESCSEATTMAVGGVTQTLLPRRLGGEGNSCSESAAVTVDGTMHRVVVKEEQRVCSSCSPGGLRVDSRSGSPGGNKRARTVPASTSLLPSPPRAAVGERLTHVEGDSSGPDGAGKGKLTTPW